MGYKKYLRSLGVILTAVLFTATVACTNKPQTVDIAGIEELVDTTDNTTVDDETVETTDEKPTVEEEDEYPGLVVVHLNMTSYIDGTSYTQEQIDTDAAAKKGADVAIYADGREEHYEHISIQYAPLDENYKYDPYDVSDLVIEIMEKAGYEEPYNNIREYEPEEDYISTTKSYTSIGGYLNPEDADKTAVSVDISEYKTLEAANERFEYLTDWYNCYDKIDFSYKPEENSRAFSNVFIKQSGTSMQCFTVQKGNVIFYISTTFFAAPRFSADAETPKPVYDLNTLEEIMTALELPYSIFYED
jgi:hypothetical protein